MSQIFELFGYLLSDNSQEAVQARRHARCPFMGTDCDGGGNRPSSNVDLEHHPQLAEFFENQTAVPSGVCSLQLHPNEPPWIVCPRRLLFLAKSGTGPQTYQQFAKDLLLRHSGYVSGTKLGIWPELRITYRKKPKSFQYTLDYVLMPLERQSQHKIEQETESEWEQIGHLVESAGYSMARRRGVDYVDDFPSGYPTIVEVMTSSTSGGNKAKRTTIPMAFEDAVLGKPHKGPGINYRQVWARMVSQLIVKSEVGLAWNGRTIWVLQDTLVDYISSSTALNVHQFLAEHTSEVNILSLSYGSSYQNTSGIIELKEGSLFSGPMSGSAITEPSFQDMIRAPILPPKSVLLYALLKRSPTGTIRVS